MGKTIFRAGRHRTIGGQTVEFSEADLAAVAAAYDAAVHEAPLVIGHPKTDDPAMGWVSGLKCVGPRLEADCRGLPFRREHGAGGDSRYTLRGTAPGGSGTGRSGRVRGACPRRR